VRCLKRHSKNSVTVEQLRLACYHVAELMKAGVSENLAIRTLELLADVFGKIHCGGSATPNHVNQVKLWSASAIQLKGTAVSTAPRDLFRVEHGTPRRHFARLVIALNERGELTQETMSKLVDDHWKLAVITLDEDRRLNRVARSKASATPEERWALAGIRFPVATKDGQSTD